MKTTEKIEYEDYDKVYAKFGLISEVQKIADDYAIEFMNWCIKNYDIEAIFIGILDNKQLLEIFKKEKGL